VVVASALVLCDQELNQYPTHLVVVVLRVFVGATLFIKA